MMKGTVKWYNKEKGFGFIAPDDGGRDIYMQSANIETEDHELIDGMRIEYESFMGRKGPEAKNIRPI